MLEQIGGDRRVEMDASSFAPSGEELFLNPTCLASSPSRAAYQVRFPKEFSFAGKPGRDFSLRCLLADRPDGVAGDRLRFFVERIERIDEDLKAMNDEKKDVFAEAKGEGFDVKILKEVIRLRKQDQNKRDERDTRLCHVAK